MGNLEQELLEDLPFYEDCSTYCNYIEDLKEIIENLHKILIEKNDLIIEVSKENQAYRKVIDKWRMEQDKTDWSK